MSIIDPLSIWRPSSNLVNRLVPYWISLASTAMAVMFAAELSRIGYAQVPVLTRSYDNERTGANTQEIILTRDSVKRGLTMTLQLRLDPDDDPHIEAQPLYVPMLKMADGYVHNVLFVCTMANSIYAYDVKTGNTLWKIKRSIGMPITPISRPAQRRPHHNEQLGETDVENPRRTDLVFWGTNDRWGILSTPVIDDETKTMYVVAWTSPDGTVERAVHLLHAIDIVTGQEKREPLKISASIRGPKGQIEFISNRQKQRAGLLLTKVVKTRLLFVAFAQTAEWQLVAKKDRPPEEKETHGWLIAFDVDRFVEAGAWPTTQVGEGGGIWQGGAGPAADKAGNIYVITSNGAWDGKTDFSETFAKLYYDSALAVDWFTPFLDKPTPSLKLLDWFTPFLDGERDLDPAVPEPNAAFDQDLGSGGPVLPRESKFVLGAGKDGILYVMPREHLGTKLVSKADRILPPGVTASFFTYLPDSSDLDPNTPPYKFAGGKTHHLHGSPVSWTSAKFGPMLFEWGENGPLMAWALDDAGKILLMAKGKEIASQYSAHWDAMFGGMLSLSANGSSEGIIWATAPVKGCWNGELNEGDANKEIVEGIAYAYSGDHFNGLGNLERLWWSREPELKGCDMTKSIDENRFTYNKFCPPLITDGKVFITTSDGRVLVYSPR